MIPLVSIVIPVYNQKSSFLIQCIESAINQTYNNLEILISNNHSTNGCDKVIDEYSLKDSRIKVIKPSIHVNMTDHFNYAGNKAKGKYISFLSSDDFLEPDCINKLMEILIQNPKVAMGYCNNNMLDDSTNVSTPIRNNSFKTGIYSPKILSDRFYNYTEYWIIGGIFKREIFIENNFPDHIVAGDWVLGFKILKYGEVAYINEVLSTIRTHERIGDAKENYSALYIQHEIERMKKHDCIIEDVDLLYKIGMPKSKAEKYKYKEQIFSYITLIRKYRNGLISENMIDEIFQKINPHQYGYFAKYFAANYKSKTCYYLSFFAGQFVKYSL